MILTTEENLYLEEASLSKFTPLIILNEEKEIIKIKNKNYNKILQVFE